MILLLWCGAVAIVNPVGDFPLNDDWAYGQNVYALSVENRLFFSDWPAMTLIAHTLWGALFCKIFGFSFTVLRFSTLLMALFGLAGFYRLLQWAGLSRQVVWMLVLLLAFNPLWFVLANSFMTDVPFLAMLLWSAFFFLKNLETPRNRYLFWATLFAFWACLIRQLGLIVPGVFFILSLYYQPVTRRNLLFAALPVLLCYAGVEIFAGWLKNTGRLPQAYVGIGQIWQTFMSNPKAVEIAVERAGIVLMTTGLFLLPLFPSLSFKHLWRKPLAWLCLLPGAYLVWKAWEIFPNGNVFYNLGLGPKLLKDSYWGEHVYPRLAEGAFLTLKCVAAAGAGLLILSFFSGREQTDRRSLLRTFSVWFVLAYGGFVCAHALLIDRYLLIFVPFFLLYSGCSAAGYSRGSLALTGLLAFFSVAATHDYLAWNLARWNAARLLEREGIAPAHIDGGFEFNGWHDTGPASQKTPGLKSWWFVNDDDWVIAFGPVYGYDRVQTMPFRRWLPPGRDSIVVNRRKPYMPVDSIRCDMERKTPDGTAFESFSGVARPGNGQNQSADRAHSGRFSLKLDAAAPFGATTPLDTFYRFDRFIIRVWRYPATADGGIVVAADDAEKAYFFEPANVIGRDSAGWGLLQMSVTLPEKSIGSKGKFYLWNPSQEQTVWFDDLTVVRYRVK